MRATRQGNQGHQLTRWQGLGIAVAVIAGVGLTYPLVSTAFHFESRTSADTVNAPDATG